jgi:hypothetical protein
MAKKITGLAIMPRVSRNGVFYFPQELAKFDGVTVPLRYNHDQSAEGIIGTATFTFDAEKGQVRYEAEITDQKFQSYIDDHLFQVSIGASVEKENQICHPEGKGCFEAPVLSAPTELSIVETPGIPESTLVVIEKICPSLEFPKEFEQFVNGIEVITSDKEINSSLLMTNETPIEKIEVTEKVEQIDTSKIVDEVVEKIQSSNEKTIKAVISEIKEAWIPKSEVSETANKRLEEKFTDEDAKSFLDRVFENGYGRLKIDKEGWIQAHTIAVNTANGQVQEAISTSGTIPGTITNTEISIQYGSKTSKPVRQFGQYQSIPTGQSAARFYKITVPDAGAITESPTTDITAVTHTLTSVDVTCSVRGWRQTVEKSELENFPGAFLNALRETARLEAMRDEHKLIVQDLAATDHDFGGTTTAPYHISGSDGSAVTTGTLEDACGEFDEDGLSFAKRYLEQLGQDTSPGNLIAFISPRAFESLMTASGLTQYTMIGNANVTRLGQLEMIYGIDIMVTNELLTNANAYRNLVCVKGKSWALASQRDMELELQKTIKGQYWDIVWTHRIGADILDANTYVIVSSIQA